MQTTRIYLFLLLSLFCVHPLGAQESVDYVRDIKPLLKAKCYSCHGVLKQEAGLRLETRQLMEQGGDSGSVLGDGDSSLLLERVVDSGESRMPPPEDGAALKSDEIKLLRAWIGRGSPAPVEATPQAPNEHWAFQPVVRR